MDAVVELAGTYSPRVGALGAKSRRFRRQE